MPSVREIILKYRKNVMYMSLNSYRAIRYIRIDKNLISIATSNARAKNAKLT